MNEDLESAEAFWRYIAGRESLIVTARERLKDRRLFMVNALARSPSLSAPRAKLP